MTAEQNKQILTAIFDEMAKGNGRPFVDAMAEDFTWIMEGSTAWSGTFRGKREVQARVLKPLFAQFAGAYTNVAERFIAEGDTVVVLCRGDVLTKSGKRYDNSYCYVIRMANGQMTELREYFDSALVDAVLDPPAFTSGESSIHS